MAGISRAVGGAGRLSAAKLRPQINCGGLLKVFESPFQREAAQSHPEGVGKGTERRDRHTPPLKAMGAAVPLRWDLERCALESTRKHLD